MRDNITFSINIEPLDNINPLISRYSCNIAAVDVVAKSFIFHKEILEKLIPTLKGAPILTYYSAYDNSFAGHEGDLYPSKLGRLKRTPPLSPVGFVDYISEPEFKIIDDKEWLNCTCYLWDGRFNYLQNLSDKEVWQSVEVAVDYDQMPDGTKVITDAILLGLALIGISPAFEGSTFYTDNFSNQNVLSEVELLKQEYKEFIDNKDLMVASSSVIEEISVNEDIATLNINASNEIEEFSNNNTNNQEKEVNEEVNKETVENLDLDKIKQEVVQMSEEEMSKSEVECAEQIEVVTESSNEFVDNPAMEALNEKSAEDNKTLAEENLENPEEVNASESEVVNESEDKDAVIMSLKTEMSDLQEKFSKMETDMNTYVEENNQLKEFKASIDKQNKEFSVETTLKEVQNILPTEEMEACRLSAEKFSLEDIDIWKNEVKAKAFNFSKGIPEKKPFIQVAFPNSDKPKSGNGLWD